MAHEYATPTGTTLELHDEYRRALLWPSNAEEQRILAVGATWSVDHSLCLHRNMVTVTLRIRTKTISVVFAESFAAEQLAAMRTPATLYIAARVAVRWGLLVADAEKVLHGENDAEKRAPSDAG